MTQFSSPQTGRLPPLVATDALETERRESLNANRPQQKEYTMLQKAVTLLMALPIFMFMPLTVNWSVKVQTPAEAEYASIIIPKASKWQKKSYGLRLGHRPGQSRIFVEEVFEDGLARPAGVFEGDQVVRGMQGNTTIFTASNFLRNRNLLKEVECFINTPSDQRRTCDLQAIDPAKPLRLDIEFAHITVSKGDPYLFVFVVFLRNVLGAICAVPIVYFWKGSNLKVLQNRRSLWMLTCLGFGRSLSHVFEILANGKINAALFSIVSQSRLVGVAILTYLMIGVKQSKLQILLLISVSITIGCFVQVPDKVPIDKYWDGFGAPIDPDDMTPDDNDKTIGILYALTKTCVTVVAGVYGQKVLQEPCFKELPMVTLQAALYIASIVPMAITTLIYIWISGWSYGLLGGATVDFRHCMEDWDPSECNSQKPVAHVEQGFDIRTLAVLAFYTLCEPIVNKIIRVFNAITKDLTNAFSTSIVYFLTVVLLGKHFNVTKAGLAIAVSLQVIQYALAPKAEEQQEQRHRAESYGMSLDDIEKSFN